MGAEIVFLGDDFTGSSDSLAAYARRGLAARLVTADGPPQTRARRARHRHGPSLAAARPGPSGGGPAVADDRA